MISVVQHEAIRAGGFTFLHKGDQVVVTREEHPRYLFDGQIIFERRFGEAFALKEALRVLSAAGDLPPDLGECVALRVRELKGETLKLITSADSPTVFCDSERFAPYYGIKDPCPATLVITDTFDTSKAFDASFFQSGDEAFGFWDIETNEISASFMYGNPVQVKMCFSDYAEKRIAQGSLFLKLRISLER